MIEIRNLRGELAELYPKTSIPIEKNNPLFNKKDEFFEDITYSFKMPGSDSNKLFFSSGHLVEAENSVYKMAIQCIVAGLPFSAGSIRYGFIDGEFDVLLLVNFADVALKVKKLDMHDLYFGDALSNFITVGLMKDTCVNPANYPYAFFPVYNENWNVGQLGRDTDTVMVNTWDHTAQAFTMPTYLGRAITPYMKLKYIIKKTFEFLGFKVVGSLIDDIEFDYIYIYTRYASKGYFLGTNTVFTRGFTIANFLKLIRDRFKVAFTFDVLNGVVRADKATSILSEDKFVNITPYVSSVSEISLPEAEGFTLVLKPDEQDDLFLDTTASSDDKKIYIPTNRLIIGGGSEKEIELNGSTLKSKVVADYSMPTTKQSIILTYRNEDFPIRFLRFTGMKAVAGGKVFPEATPLELNLNDAIWNRFLNDSKTVLIKANMPLSILMELQGNYKIEFKSNEGQTAIALIEKLPFDLTNEYREFIPVEIRCHTITPNIDTTVVLEPVLPTVTAAVNALAFKSYFNSDETNFDKVQFEIVNPANSTTSGIQTIIKSTDKSGSFGSVLYPSYLASGDRLSVHNFELRIYQGAPKWLIVRGQKLFFSTRDGYWYVKYNEPFPDWGVTDGIPVWIVF